MTQFNMDELEKLAEFATANSVWKPADVTQEPHTRLTQWQVHLVKGKLSEEGGDTIHFMGHTGYEGRVCSPVQTYDKTTRRGVTKSGRIYELVGHPGHNGDAFHVWATWLSMMGNPEVEIVTEQYE